MADGLRPFPMLSPEALKRLQKNERAQASKTKAQGLAVEFVSVEALWLLQRGCCVCPNCERTPMDPEGKGQEPDAPVIAHVFLRKRKGGHTIENVRLWRHACNAAMAATENRDTALGDRMAVNWTKKDEPELIETRPSRSPRKWQSAGFDRTKTRGFNGKVRERT